MILAVDGETSGRTRQIANPNPLDDAMGRIIILFSVAA
jgi:hypothetical protein